MKKEKKNYSNIITITALSLLCLGILGGAFLLNRNPEPAFEPEASEPAAETVTWSEPETKPAAASIPMETEEQTRELQAGTPDDEIQVVESDGDEVVISLTPPVTKPAREVTAAESKPAKSCPDNPSPAPAEAVPAPTETAPDAYEQQTAAPDSSSSSDSQEHEGQVYDPVFGWLTPGIPQADVLDNDGDVNKQIGYIE